MKLRLLFAALFSLSTIYSYAGKVIINASLIGTTAKFEPNDVNVPMGDTVFFQWVNDVHTTTSTSIPMGATAWDSPLDNTQQTFVYVPTVPGVYNYVCTPHASMGMTGKFTVQNPVSVPEVTAVNPTGFIMWPNPATSATHIRFGQYQEAVNITVSDITGTVLISNNYVNVVDADVDISHLPQGRYLLYATDGRNMHTEQLVVE